MQGLTEVNEVVISQEQIDIILAIAEIIASGNIDIN